MSRQRVIGTTTRLPAPIYPGEGTGYVPVFRPLVERAVALWRWIEGKRTQQLAQRRLRVSETVSLGEKRFVSIVQVDGAQFLIGGSASSVNLLAILEGADAASAMERIS